tara:strand:- start:1030 stop:1134 length:105 start_codon:yes stop_codon:yes gene_type:complete
MPPEILKQVQDDEEDKTCFQVFQSFALQSEIEMP